MAATSEIQKLERRHAENPDGRYFAPLADAYRKSRQVDEALILVRAGIEKHPDYLSAHIVLGRCLLDKKEDEGAGQAFERVLGLDAENIIALKSLSEIAERRGDPLGARQWLQKLLVVDPMNADADADLQRLGGAIVAAPTVPMEALPADLEADQPSGYSFADVTPGEPGADMLPESAQEADLGLEPLPADVPSQVESGDAFEVQRDDQEEWPAAGQVAEVAPLLPEPDAEVELAASLADLPIIMPEDVTPAEEMARPSRKQQRAVVEALPELPAVAESAPAEPESPPLVTETMGDLYLRQGFRAEAAEVYRSVLAQRPDDARLREKLAALEAPPPALSARALGGESVRVWLRRVASARVPAPVPVGAGAVPAGPSPLEEAFAQPEAPAEPAGEPAHPAQDAFTLDVIFGGQPGASPAPEGEAAPPAAPSGTSFDEFFGAPAEQASVRPDPAAQPEAPPADDDISSFNTWLRGLKR